MKNTMTPFREVIDDRHAWIERYKRETGRKVAGYFCDYVPEEILWAAGMATIRITGGRGNVVAADAHLQSNVCSFARRCFDQALEGTYHYLDALVVPHTCDVITKMYDLWAYRMKEPQYIQYLWVPHKVFDKDAGAVMEGEFRRLKKTLEEHLGAPIENEALVDAIKLYDRSRSLLKRVYELRAADPGRISGEDAFAVSLSSTLAPRDVHVRWMEALLEDLEAGAVELDRRPRVLIASSMLDDLELIRAVERSGAWAVADDVCTGSRYFFDLVGEFEGDPLKALSKRYLGKLPCPRSVGAMEPRRNHIMGQAAASGAAGIIFYILRCCDAHLFQYPLLNERMQKEGYKVLYVQGDQTVGINEAIENRIKAFTEMLQS